VVSALPLIFPHLNEGEGSKQPIVLYSTLASLSSSSFTSGDCRDRSTRCTDPPRAYVWSAATRITTTCLLESRPRPSCVCEYFILFANAHLHLISHSSSHNYSIFQAQQQHQEAFEMTTAISAGTYDYVSVSQYPRSDETPLTLTS
jgi:hypothetical protein